MTQLETIYVALLDEGVDVCRPVSARRLAADTYVIAEQAYDRDTETWAFEPGTVVTTCTITRDGEKVPLATALAINPTIA